jgi:hypothetical protein
MAQESPTNKRFQQASLIWDDLVSNNEALKKLAQELQKSQDIAILNAEQQITLLFSQADFCHSFDERVYVARVFKKRIEDLDILPLVTEHQGLQLASKCLVSLSLFEGYMWHRTNRHGAPSPDFYRQVGKSQFERFGRADVARDFDDWTVYIKSIFAHR